MIKKEQMHKVLEFIERGNEIKEKEYHPAGNGLGISRVSGPLFETWMSEIKIFNDRYLEDHPLHSEIGSTIFHNKGQATSFKNMMGYLEALANDSEYWYEQQAGAIGVSHIAQTVEEEVKML